jgi:spermidine synthase
VRLLTRGVLAAATTGFISLSYEILWFRAISFATGTNPTDFGILLGFYLSGLAVGGYLALPVCRREDRRGDPRYLRGTGAFLLAANLAGFLVLPAFAWLATGPGWVLGLPLLAAASAMLGTALPLISHFAVEPEGAIAGEVAAIYAANILGSVAGTLLTGYVLVNRWDTGVIAGWLLGAGCLVSAVLLVQGRRRAPGLVGAAAAAVLVAGMAAPRVFDRYYDRLLYKRHFSSSPRLAHVVENRNGIIAVTQDGTVYGGGAYDGRISTSLLADRNKIERAYAIRALHPAAERTLMIGLSTGAWAQVLANDPAVRSLTIVEINPGYLSLIPQYPQVASLLANPKVKIVIDDGRRWLSRHPEQFDLIVSNTMQHWRAHASALLSREYVALVGAHLKPGGVYYFNATGSDEALKTAMTAFPYGLRYMSFVAVGTRPLALDSAVLRRAFGSARVDGKLVLDQRVETDRRRLDELVGTADVESRSAALARVAGAPLVTDDNMYPEWHSSVHQ